MVYILYNMGETFAVVLHIYEARAISFPPPHQDSKPGLREMEIGIDDKILTQKKVICPIG